jgi:trehalose 6-phosphate synthase/phosphatase
MTRRLLIVSNRLPVAVRMEGDRAVVRRSVGGLASGLSTPHQRSGGLWIGWPGIAGSLDPGVTAQLHAMSLRPLPLDAHEVEVFYEHIANAVLWPILHDRIDRLPLRIDGWDVFEAVSARYADAVAEHYQPGDLIWVHDYHLMRVPALIRDRLPEARVGFFLHVPFPNPEIFFTLPTRADLVGGMMGADLVGFHTRRYHGHFRAALRRLFSLEADRTDAVPWGDRRVQLGVYPIGIDAPAFDRGAETAEVGDKVGEYRAPGQRLLVGVDRLDYTKGISRRLLAVERLLELYPEWRERVRLIQVAVPSRDEVGAYRDVRREVDGLVGQINGRFATPNWMPIHYLYRSVSASTLSALYRAADVMLVTPLRDGMNLVAKEFVASRADEDGVLVLSEFAGAAESMREALIVNPYDIDGTARAIHRGLTMVEPERADRMRALRANVRAYDVHRWATDFLDTLAGPERRT